MRLFSCLLLCLMLTPPVLWAEDEAEQLIMQRGEARISHAELDARLRQIPERDRKPFLASAKRLQDILAQLLLREQLALDAREAGFDQQPETQAVMNLAAEHALAEQWLMHYVDTLPPADYEALARERYLSQTDKFMSEPSVDVTHLLVSSASRSEEEALDIAENLMQQVEANPEAFDALVLQHSDDPSASSNRGRFAGVKAGHMVPPFEKAAFGLTEPGSFAGPVKTQYGYHIIRLDQRHEARQLSFEEVRPTLEAAAERQHRDRLRKDYLSSIGKAPVELREGAVQEILLRYFSEEEIREMGLLGAEGTDSQ